MTEPDKKLNWRQAAERLGCSKSKLYRMVASGEIKAHRVGMRGMWIYESEINRHIKLVEDS